MILIILLKVRNLKNVTKFTIIIIITTKIMIVTVTIRKSISPIKVVLIVVNSTPSSPTSKETVFILGNSMSC